MKKIGFIDYFLDEWHAHKYPGWIRENILANERDCCLRYAWAAKDKSGGMSTNAYCDLYGLQASVSIEELVECSDYIVVLSPDNPEQHEALAAIPLASGKPVYIDKSFSPDLRTGRRIFERAAKYGTRVFSSSALRFSKELGDLPKDKFNEKMIETVAAFGPGAFENYAVHQLEMIISQMGVGVKRIKSLSAKGARSLVFDYADGRRASMFQGQDVPFQASIQANNRQAVFIGECSDYFSRFIHEMLEFFQTDTTPVPMRQTLQIMALLEAGNKALHCDDVWIDVENVL